MEQIKMVYCKKCNRYVSKNCIGSAYVKRDNSIKQCKACGWMYRNQKLIDEIINENEFNKAQIDIMINNLYNKENVLLNDIANELCFSIERTIELFKRLNPCNVKTQILFNCENCNQESTVSITGYLNSKYHYCSQECYWEDKPNKVPKGEDSPFYNRIHTCCDNCGKEIDTTPYHANKTNKYGESHNFCCHKCYSEFRSKYYIKEKSVNWQRVFSEQMREKRRLYMSKRAKSENCRNSKIQLIINDILDSCSIKYEREYDLHYRQIDNYLLDYNLMIEVQGDYWHGNPLIYNKNGRKLNKTQLKDIVQDKCKHTLAQNKGIEILYLWESDIINNPELCKSLILFYISNNGNILNYNSFNWNYQNNILSLNKNVIYSYIELPYNESKAIAKNDIKNP